MTAQNEQTKTVRRGRLREQQTPLPSLEGDTVTW